MDELGLWLSGEWPLHVDSALLVAAGGIHVMALAHGWRWPAVVGGSAVFAIAASKVTGYLLMNEAGDEYVLPTLAATGYILVAISMLLLSERNSSRHSAIAIGLTALPFLGSVFFLVAYVVDASLLAPSNGLKHLSPHSGLALLLMSSGVLTEGVQAWRKRGHYSARIMLIAALGSFASMAVAIWLAIIWTNYVATVTQAEQQVMQAANFIDGYAERALEGADLLAQKTMNAVDIDANGRPSIASEEWQEVLAAKGSLPQVQAVSVSDENGDIIASSSILPRSGVNIADRSYFKLHRDADLITYLGATITLKTSTKNVFTITNRLERSNHSFAGVVIVAIDTDHFTPIFARFAVGDDSVAALAKTNGELLAVSANRGQKIQATWADAPAFRYLDKTASDKTIVVRGELDDDLPRIVAMRTNQRMGTLTIASATQSSILAAWKRSCITTAAVLITVLGGGALLAHLGHRSIRREEALQLRAVTLVSFQNAVLDSTSAAILAVNNDGVITLFNRAAETLFGYSAIDMVAKRTPDCLFDAFELAERAEELSRELNHQVPANYRVVAANALTDPDEEREWTCIRGDGSKIPVTVSVSALRDPDGQVVGFLGMMNGISARKKAERELRYSEARLRAILDNVIDGIITINAHGIIQSVNPAAERIFGYAASEVTSRNVKILMGEPHHSRHDTYLTNYLRTGDAQIIGRGREVEGRRKDGTMFPLDLAVSQVDLSGRAMFVGMIRDLTELKRNERLKSEFVSTVSHELRTPLTAIRGSLSLINSGIMGEISEDVRELTVVAEQSSERLVRLINDILDVEKIGSGQMKLDMKPTDLAWVVERAITDTRVFAEQFGVRLGLTQSVASIVISGDPDRLVQIFTNLLSNAAKFSPRDSEVSVSITQPSFGWIRVSVTDRGIGISDEFRSRIFDKFAQADGSDSKAKGGTGLGLNITKSLVEKMNGAISFESEAGQGTTFHVDFPLPEDASAPLASRRTGKLRVLHVEDDAAVRKMVARLLAGEAEVIGAPTVEEGLALADSQAFDLAIVDLGLGDGSGLDVAPRLQSPEGLLPPVIVFSAHDHLPGNIPSNVARCLVKSRATDRELAETVRALMSRSGTTLPPRSTTYDR